MATYYEAGLASDYTHKWRHDSPRRAAIYSTWLNALGNVEGLKVIDVACGSGATSRMLAEKGAHVVGLDLSAEQLAYAREEEASKPLGIEYYQADLRDDSSIPVFKEPFDAITPTFLFNYAEDRAELKKMAEACGKLLRPEGKMSAITINPFHPIEESINGEGADATWEDESRAGQEGAGVKIQLYDGHGQPITPFITHFFSASVYESVLQEAGFRDIRWVKLEIPAEHRQSFPEWERLEKNVSVIVFSAVKSF